MIRAMRTAVGRSEAADILNAAAPLSVRVERKLLYPFRWFLFRCSTSTLLGESTLRISCLVDVRTGLSATADPFEIEELEAPRDAVLEPKLSENEGRRIAQRYVAYAVRGKRKALVAPRLDLLEAALVYKPFWIVRCYEKNSREFSVLVDGVTGGFYPLPGRALRVDPRPTVP